MEEKKKVQALMKRVVAHGKVLKISRVPPPTEEDFKRLASAEFCNDYGMTLKWLMDNYAEKEQLLMIVDQLHEILGLMNELLKQKHAEQQASDVIKLASGKTIRRKE